MQILDRQKDRRAQGGRLHQLDERVSDADGDGTGLIRLGLNEQPGYVRAHRIAGRSGHAERVEQRRERAPRFDLIRAASVDGEAAPLRMVQQIFEQPRLPDSGFAFDDPDPKRSGGGALDHLA